MENSVPRLSSAEPISNVHLLFQSQTNYPGML